MKTFQRALPNEGIPPAKKLNSSDEGVRDIKQPDYSPCLSEIRQRFHPCWYTTRKRLLGACGRPRRRSFSLLPKCERAWSRFCVRLVQNRRLAEWTDEAPRYLLDEARQLPTLGQRTLDIPAKPVRHHAQRSSVSVGSRSACVRYVGRRNKRCC